jgi:hypothetical protein
MLLLTVPPKGTLLVDGNIDVDRSVGIKHRECVWLSFIWHCDIIDKGVVLRACKS